MNINKIIKLVTNSAKDGAGGRASIGRLARGKHKFWANI